MQPSPGPFGSPLTGYATGGEQYSHSASSSLSSVSGYHAGYSNTAAFVGHQAYAVPPHTPNTMQPVGYPYQTGEQAPMNRTARTVPQTTHTLPSSFGHESMHSYAGAHNYALDQHATNTNWNPPQYPQSMPRSYTPAMSSYSPYVIHCACLVLTLV